MAENAGLVRQMSFLLIFILALTVILYVGMGKAISRMVEPRSARAWLILPLVIYVGFAFVIKAMIVSLVGWQPIWQAGWIAAVPTNAEALEILWMNLIYVTSILVAMIVALNLQPERKVTSSVVQAGSGLVIPRGLYLLFYALVGLKIIVAMLFGWGRPGLVPTFTIPLVTGIANILSKDGLTTVFMVLTVIFARQQAMGKNRIRSYIGIALAYIGCDILLGLKSNLVLGCLGLLFVLLCDARNQKSGYTKLLGFIFFILTIFPAIYAFSNIFRFIRLDESLSWWEAAKSTRIYMQMGNDAGSGSGASSLEAIILRITGFEGIVAAVTIPDFYYGVFDLVFRDDINQRYTEVMTGATDGNFAIGGTIAGSAYLLCNGNSICSIFVISSVHIPLFITILFGLFYISNDREISIGVALSLSLVIVHMQLATGALFSFVERMIIVYCVAITMKLIVSIYNKRGASTPRHVKI